jgi:hypothetical protein
MPERIRSTETAYGARTQNDPPRREYLDPTASPNPNPRGALPLKHKVFRKGFRHNGEPLALADGIEESERRIPPDAVADRRWPRANPLDGRGDDCRRDPRVARSDGRFQEVSLPERQLLLGMRSALQDVIDLPRHPLHVVPRPFGIPGLGPLVIIGRTSPHGSTLVV